MVGTAGSVLIRGVSLIWSVLYREVSLYVAVKFVLLAEGQCHVDAMSICQLKGYLSNLDVVPNDT